ncbi:MAG: hypothetical protein HYS23_02050 [Geobacter sp.]|nr:hypothetical protein [Geobacter sp.]
MKTLKLYQRTLLVFVTALAIFSVSACAAKKNWVLLDSTPDHSDFFYDKDSLVRTPEGLLTVWARVAYMADGRQEVMDVLKNEKFRNISHSLYQYEINCNSKQSRLNRVVHFDASGGKIAEYDLTGKTEWEAIPVASRLDQVVDEECPEVK